MTTYRVCWEIDVEADSPREAAIVAMRMQNEETTANVFDVTEICDSGSCNTTHKALHEVVAVDLGDVPRSLILEGLERVEREEINNG